MKKGLIGIIYFDAPYKKDNGEYLIKTIIEALSKYNPEYKPIFCLYQMEPLKYPVQTKYQQIEDPKSYKKRVTADWGVKVVNDLEMLLKEKKPKKRKNTKKRKRKKEKNETKGSN